MATYGEYFKQTISSMLNPYPLQILLHFPTFLKIIVRTCVPTPLGALNGPIPI